MVRKKLCDLGFNLEERRREKGLTQIQIANAAGVSIVTYQRWEWGSTKEVNESSFDTLLELLK